MEYTDDYIYSKDIDWFCIVNGYFVHVASAGGMIPPEINDDEKLKSLQKKVFDAPEFLTDEEIVINHRFLEHKFSNLPDKKIAIENYLSSFKVFAKKGFISLDRTDIANQESNIYHIVCMPKNLILVEDTDGYTKYKTFTANLLTTKMDDIRLLEELQK